MKIGAVTFVTSVADEANFLKSEKPIVAVAGKSNVGKSSFINMLANHGKLAKTSNTPGRTRLINYFDFGEFLLADLPGYGYAEVSKAEREKWANLMEKFFEKTEIAHVFSLMDSRHDPTADDLQMVSFLYHYAFPFTVIATKTDKLKKSEFKPRLSRLAASLKLGEQNVLPVSAVAKTGREAVIKKCEEIVNVFKENKSSKETE